MPAPPPRPHPLARAPLVDRLNGWLERAWASGLAAHPTLDPDALWFAASRKADPAGEHGGRSEAEVADFRARLWQLCESLTGEAQLNPLGRTIAHGQLVRVIRQRLRLGTLWQARPHIAATPIATPILVVGHMRSGTTRIHRLLAADPAHAATRFCDSWHPVPESPDMRPVWSALSLFMGRKVDPWLDTIHPFGVTRPDEELGWLASALDHCAYEAQWRIPSFSAFSEALDPAPVYREFARILATDAANHGNAARPRVLKVPQFAEDLPALLAQFPQAMVVRATRSAEEIEASAASLLANQMTIQSDAVDMDWIRSECRRKITLRESRMNDALAGFAGPLAQVDFAMLQGDWQAEIARAYAVLGLDLSAAALAAMQAEEGKSATSAHHHHRHALEGFAEAAG